MGFMFFCFALLPYERKPVQMNAAQMDCLGVLRDKNVNWVCNASKIDQGA